MAPTLRQSRDQAAVRERILSAARELFIAHGYDAVSLRKIAASIGYTAPALYTHFPDKSALMLALCQQDFATFAAVFARLNKVVDPIVRIRRGGEAYLRFAMEHPNHYRLMFMTPVPIGVEPDAECLAAQGDPDLDSYSFLHSAVQEAMDLGRFRPEYKDAQLLTQIIWATLHGVVSLEITHRHDPWLDWRPLARRSRTMTDALMRGLLSPAGVQEAGL